MGTYGSRLTEVVRKATSPSEALNFHIKYIQPIHEYFAKHYLETPQVNLILDGADGRTYHPSSQEEWEKQGDFESGDVLYECIKIKTYNRNKKKNELNAPSLDKGLTSQEFNDVYEHKDDESRWVKRVDIEARYGTRISDIDSY